MSITVQMISYMNKILLVLSSHLVALLRDIAKYHRLNYYITKYICTFGTVFTNALLMKGHASSDWIKDVSIFVYIIHEY